MLLRRKKSVLCIEITPWGVTITEGMNSARQIKITKSVQITDFPDTKELLLKKIARTIKRMRVKTKVVYLVIYHPHIEEQYFQFMNLSKKEIAILVKRKVTAKETELLAKLQRSDKDEINQKSSTLYFDSQLRGKEGAIFAVAPQKLIDDYVHFLESIELKPQLITSLPLTLANTLFLMAQDVKNSNNDYISFLYIAPRQAWVVITNQNTFFSREIVFQGSGSKTQGSEVANDTFKSTKLSSNTTGYKYLLQEATRFFLYVKQQDKDKQISSLLVSSDKELPEGIVEDLTERLQVSVALFNPEKKMIEGETLKKGSDKPELLKISPISMGLLADTNNQISINLVPLTVRDHKKHMAGRLLIALFLIAYCISGVAGYIGLSWARENYRRAADSQQQSIASLKPRHEQAKKNEQERQTRDFHLSALKKFGEQGPLWRGVLYELSLLSSPNLVLSSLDIIGSNRTWRLQTKGVVSAETSKEARQYLQNFLKHLETSVFFSQPKATDIRLIPNKKKGRSVEVNKTGTQLRFSLSCNIMH